MNGDNDLLYEQTVEAITKLFSDQSVPVSTTKTNLKQLIGEITVLLDSLPSDTEGDC